MRRLCVFQIVLSLACQPTSQAESGWNPEEVVRYAKTVDVSKLDATLAPQSLAEWFRVGPAAGAEVRWQTSDCSEKKEPPGGYPLCVKFTFLRANVSVWGMVKVGTQREGIRGEPEFRFAMVTTEDLAKGEYTAKLSDISRLIAERLSES